MSIIEVSGVSCGYGRHIVAENISFSVEAGVTILLGRNGSGKSTLIKAMAGLLPYRGSIMIAGSEISKCRRRALAQKISYLPQRQTIPAGITTLEYVALGANPESSLFSSPGKAALERAKNELELVGGTELTHRDLSTLSGGEARIAALARASMQESHIMLMDEPLAGLDFARQHEFMELISHGKRPVFMSLHDPALAWQYGDRILLMENGKVSDCGNDESEFEQGLQRLYGEKLRFEHAGETRLPLWHN